MIENLTKELYDKIESAKDTICSCCEERICESYPEDCPVMSVVAKLNYRRTGKPRQISNLFVEHDDGKVYGETEIPSTSGTRERSSRYHQAGGMGIIHNYEVAFVVYGYISNKDDNIGEIEYNGLTKSSGMYVLDDARIYFNIIAKTPQEAYQHGLRLMESGAADFGDVTVEDWHLEHVVCGDCYWYKEDLKD